ncbi:MAG: exo-beta-N-acetylmuramidase NamZ domain-containing protein, partial [Thermoanaerobaculales bacterium]
WALLANQAAVTADLDPARGALATAAVGPLVRLFSPEHGLDGVAQDMEAVSGGRDFLTGVDVRSLYGSSAETLAPALEDLQDIEVLIVDLPDIGTRHYTFAASMDAAMAVCARAGIEVIVLDRPNPVGGVAREGGLVRPGFVSFVSQLPTPVRHGLTLGELALLLHRERHQALELSVVPCRGWRRSDWWDETGLPWVPPSPNMPSLETAAFYPGLCLIEATTLSEGRGTTRPFHLVGAPWVDAEALVRALRRRDLPGVAFRAVRFRPEFQKHAGEVCSGVELHLTDRNTLQPLALGLELLSAFLELDPGLFSWRPEPYEFVAEVPALDLLTGSSAAREVLEGSRDLAPLLAGWSAEVAAFEETLEGVLLYR